ncbi:MAG: thiamine pyrophosphate-dependent enzyme [Chloroflexi bacterium]|nr:thiamine pyrophosphate-dependent enzyme [Chloroflexota bacterium]
MRDAMRAVKAEDPKAIVLLAETSIMAFADVSEPEDVYLPVGAMSKASSVGLGVALAQPDRNVVIFDGDGSLLMNLGSLVTIGKQAPKNLVHILLVNDVYALTGGQPIPSAERGDLPGIARDAGYKTVVSFDNIEQFASELPAILNEDGPTFVALDTVTEVTNAADWKNYPRPPKGWVTAAPEMRESLAGE